VCLFVCWCEEYLHICAFWNQIRKLAAEHLYIQLETSEEQIMGEQRLNEQIKNILLNTPWISESDAFSVQREKLYDIFQIPKPAKIKAPDSEKKSLKHANSDFTYEGIHFCFFLTQLRMRISLFIASSSSSSLWNSGMYCRSCQRERFLKL
jgi:hypothetical protein